MIGDGIYRVAEDRLGASERDEEAVRMFGRWRDRTKARILALFGTAGVLGAAITYYVTQELQYAHNRGVAFVKVSAIVAAAVWFLVFVVGAFVARRVVRARTPAKLDELAKAYEVPVESLRSIATMVDTL